MQRLLAVVAVAAVPLLGACTMIPGFEPPAPQAELPPPVELPETGSTLPGVLAGQPNLQTLVAALEVSGLAETLAGPGPYTIFAPTDQAFARLPPGTIDQLFEPQNRPVLVRILSYHVLPAEQSAAGLAGQSTVATVEGGSLRITPGGQRLRVGTAEIVQADIAAENGVVHIIDTVQLP